MSRLLDLLGFLTLLVCFAALPWLLFGGAL